MWFRKKKKLQVPTCFYCRRVINFGEGGASLYQNGHVYHFCCEHSDRAEDVPFY